MPSDLLLLMLAAKRLVFSQDLKLQLAAVQRPALVKGGVASSLSQLCPMFAPAPPPLYLLKWHSPATL